jgi:hypothetical protein
MNKLKEQTSLKAMKAAIRENMVAMGYFNKPKVQPHKNKKAYNRKQFKRIDDL